jgi:hypothetical protein
MGTPMEGVSLQPPPPPRPHLGAVWAVGGRVDHHLVVSNGLLNCLHHITVQRTSKHQHTIDWVVGLCGAGDLG